MNIFKRNFGAKRNILSPYSLDQLKDVTRSVLKFSGKRIFFDGAFKGDYSLAAVNRNLGVALVKAGAAVSFHTAEVGWRADGALASCQTVASRFVSDYPQAGLFDIHLRNTWPPVTSKMVGKINAYVCFAWEETELPFEIVADFNKDLDLVMVTSQFVADVFIQSGVRIPVYVVGNGVDHFADIKAAPLRESLQKKAKQRVLHISSCFPRKGADVLVDAFASEFTSDHDVELLIKTFPNPHNDIEDIVEKSAIRFQHSAPIRVVMDSLTEAEIQSLILSADVLVMPSRGEGFGLPAAEALLSGIPVIATGFSGEKDFCSTDSAWLLDYKLTRANAHVSGSGSLWAEPDKSSLSTALRQALAEPAIGKTKAAYGKALLKAHFKWSDVARRVAVALYLATGEKTTPAKLPNVSIDLVSTWQQVCGIATYSEHLFSTKAFSGTLRTIFARELRNDVLPENDDQNANRTQIVRPWGYERAGIERLADALLTGSADVLWFQHHPGFFSSGDMIMLTGIFEKSAYRQKVITLHNAKETVVGHDFSWLKKFDTVFVHTADDAELLSGVCNITSKVLPHGIHSVSNKTPIHDKTPVTIGTFGFLVPHKNVPLMIDALARARSVVPHMRLKLLTCVRPDRASQQERAIVEHLIDAYDLHSAVDFDVRFQSDNAIQNALQDCTFLCFPYGESTESATGAVRIALAADRPLLCSNSGVLRDVKHLSLELSALSADVLAEAFVVLAAAPELMTLKDGVRRSYVNAHSFEAIGQRYLATLLAAQRRVPL